MREHAHMCMHACVFACMCVCLYLCTQDSAEQGEERGEREPTCAKGPKASWDGMFLLFKYSFSHRFFSQIFFTSSFPFFSPPLLPLLSPSFFYSFPSFPLSRVVKDIWTVRVAQIWGSIFENRGGGHLIALHLYNLEISNSLIHSGPVCISPSSSFLGGRVKAHELQPSPLITLFLCIFPRLTEENHTSFWMEHLAGGRGPGSCS